MFKKITLVIVGLVSAITFTRGQAAWEFVGPKSNNNFSGAEFETSQMTKVLTNPNAPGMVFATSKFAGLWISNNTGGDWTNVDMSSTGMDQALAIANKNANEILIGNYHDGVQDNTPNFIFSYSSRVSSYNFNTNTWFHYPLLPTPSGKFTIKSIAVHPDDQNIIYAGTTKGLFRYNGSSWNLIVPNCNIETVLFADNITSEVVCYVSGSDQAEGSATPAKAMILVSTDSGNSVFNSFVSTFNSDVNIHPKSHSQICAGPAGSIFVLTVCYGTKIVNSLIVDAEYRYLHHIVKSGNVYTPNKLDDWEDNGFWGIDYTNYSDRGGSSMDRMAIAYNAILNAVFLGAVRPLCQQLYIVNNNFISQPSLMNNQNDTKMLNGKIHHDIHDFHVNGSNIWVACDGGIALSVVSQGPFGPIFGLFNRKNNKLDVSLLYGFSGSEKNQKIYAFGGHDITNNDIYDATPGQDKNIYTHSIVPTNENDGAFIYKFDENLVIMDEDNNTNITKVSINGGQSIFHRSPSCNPNPSPPFSSNPTSSDGVQIRGGTQRTIQDPFRQGRIYQLGRFSPPSLFQFDFLQNKMVYKVGFDPSNFNPTTSKVHPWQIIQDISFSAISKNSLYVLTSNYSNAPSAIIRYIGPDLDDCWSGHNEYVYPNPYYPAQSPPTLSQWAEITPDYTNLGTILGGDVVNIAAADMGRISLKKIETSITNLDLIYVAGNFDYNWPNNTIKVLKFDGFNWTNYSSGIPADAMVTTMVMDHYSNDALYLGTDQGVYYRDASSNVWEPYYTGVMPKQRITQMEINYKENTVRASTFGRGIFKSPLKCPDFVDINLYNNPAGYYEGKKITHAGTQITSQTATMLRAKEDITLLPGMFVAPSITKTYFEALIHDCYGGSSSPYLFKSAPSGSGNQNEDVFAGLKNEKEVNNSFEIYPNPSNGIYNIKKKSDEEFLVEVYNLQGALVKSKKFRDRETQIDISEFSSGLYTFLVKAENGANKVFKVVKN